MSLGFGTSGVRGLVTSLTDRECALYTRAFIRHVRAASPAATLSLSGDLRFSTPRILRAVAFGARFESVTPEFCGYIPTPALALHALANRQPAIMVTGSHIPDDRNGIKFYLPEGEILKADEQSIQQIHAQLKASHRSNPSERSFDQAFDSGDGLLPERVSDLGDANPAPQSRYRRRYTGFFSPGALRGRRIVVYEHSAVGRDVLAELVSDLGAEPIRVGRSDRFIPVDTEAVENPDRLAAWVREHRADALISADGDSDRPLLSDERGGVVRGDVMGILAAWFLEADAVAAPVSCNTALELSGHFGRTMRTRIGSPYVVEALKALANAGGRRVVGYEANGGFLLASTIPPKGGASELAQLPTRDAVLPLFAVLCGSAARGKSVSQWASELPQRFTWSGLLRGIPAARAQAVLDAAVRDSTLRRALTARFGEVNGEDHTDGVRLTFAGGSIVHLRPSGNAPEFRCYTEAATEAEAKAASEFALARITHAPLGPE